MVASVVVASPPYLDAAYYEVVARRLAEGQGFDIPVVWSFLEVGGQLPSDPTLPVPANRHWMPLTAIVSAGSMALFGPSRFAAELPHVLLGAALVPLTAWVGWWLWRSRTVAVTSGILALFAGPMLIYVPMVDSFALFGMTGIVAILASIQAVRSGAGGWLVVSATAAALATLTRVDGVLLASAPLTAWLIRRSGGGRAPIGAVWLLAAAATGAAILAPWLLRQLSEFGTALPSAGGRLLWISSYNEQFSISGDPSFASYLEQGLPSIGAQKAGALVELAGRTTVLLGGVFAVPFVFGMWRDRRRPDLAPFLVYWLVLFAAMVLVFTLHAPAGAYYHSAWAWLPIAMPLAVANARPVLDALGERWALFRRPRNARFLAAASMAGAVTLSIVGSGILATQWSRDRAKVEAAAAFLRGAASASEVVMYVDPPSLYLLTGNPTVAPPFDPPDVIGQVARAYGVRWVVVERTAGARTDVLRLWDGQPWMSDRPLYERGDVRVFATDF